MSKRLDLIGERGENLFRAFITKWCNGAPWFTEVTHLGGKAEALDFMVTLVGSTVFRSTFFVQVKATAKKLRYTRTGKKRRLRVGLRPADAVKLGKMKLPVYVAGVDVLSEKIYLRHVKAETTRGFNGISTRRPLNCRSIKLLWQEVEDFWVTKPGGLTTSDF